MVNEMVNRLSRAELNSYSYSVFFFFLFLISFLQTSLALARHARVRMFTRAHTTGQLQIESKI